MRKLLLAAIQIMVVARVWAQPTGTNTFTNPILHQGADPWVIQRDGYYYYTKSTGKDLELWKTTNMAYLDKAEHKVIWTPPPGTKYSEEIWAPELHFVRGKWYMYFAADDGFNRNHRIYALENASPDPMQGQWNFKGQVGDAANKWAIDVSEFELKGKIYLLWSGWEGDDNGQQNIYIAELATPTTVKSKRVLLSYPQYPWEKFGNLNAPGNPPHVNVNEGPEILKHGNKLFLVYSASGCWTDHYCLGMLSADINSDPLDPASWTKRPTPLFKTDIANQVYAPGHNAFFKSPDGKQDWIIYHANPAPGCGCDGKRSPRIQQFTWNADGTPDLGQPVRTGEVLDVPE